MCRFCIYRDYKSVFITVITKTELPKTLRSVQCHRKKILSANCEALCHFDKLRITAKCICVKMCNFISHLQMCQCLLILLSISFLGYTHIESWYDVNYNSPTVCSGQLISQRHCFFRFEISWNRSFCPIRSLASFDSKVTTRIGIGFGTRLRTMHFSSS